jgi:hypothetical protein
MHPDAADMYSDTELVQIQDLMSRPRAQVACPRCGKTFLMVGPIGCFGPIHPKFGVICKHRNVCAFITEVPGTRWSEAET